MSLTKEQELAVVKDNTNIIVSAGAGSGKTTVLKTRVIKKLKDGANINDLIILTFTNNAANEMKRRIRDAILEDEALYEQSELVDSAYITTFDSFAQSLVKKYNYLLNISNNFTIVDDNIVATEINKIIDDIFDEYYQSEDENFIRLISDFCIKDDDIIRDSIKNIYKKLCNHINRSNYLDSYLDTYYNEERINFLFNEYESIVFRYRDEASELLSLLDDETNKIDVVTKNNYITQNFLEATTYEELRCNISFRLVDARGDIYTENGKLIKSQITDLLKKLKAFLSYTKEELINQYKLTKNYAIIIVDILRKLDHKLNEFKYLHNAYQFNDIALKAIELVKNYESVRDEIKNKTKEIMIDEYQDTSDIQEAFISYIENNNVYMVGDIKQSIYRFRNANPYIFKKKYDDYKDEINGFKIDLNKNFRSRRQVVENINTIFDLIMTDLIGGANYKDGHQMIFGYEEYLNHEVNKNYDMEIYSYDKKDTTFKESEIEAFIIADDILKRINNKEKVTRIKDNKMYEDDLSYKDFVILIDKGKYFDILKKILESKGIPAVIDKDIDIKDEDEIYLLKNIINLLIHIKDENFDVSFKHSYLSVARSYIIRMDDDTLFNIIKDESWKDTKLYQDAKDITLKLDSLSNKEILMEIVNKFNIIEKLIEVGDVEERITKLEYFINNATSLNEFGFDIYELSNYFDEVLKSDNDIKMSRNAGDVNAVKIMTIHKSKGLEYNYVYLPFLGSDFTRGGKKYLMNFNNEFGIISPFYLDGKGDTFLSEIYKSHEYLETLSEKIRVFYVALTRAREKLILINEFNPKIDPGNGYPTYSKITNAKSISDLLTLIKPLINKYIINVDIDSLNIDKEYNIIKKQNYQKFIPKSNELIKIEEINIDNYLLTNRHFSKSLMKVIDKSLKEKLDFGTHMHYVFEVYDFNHDNLDELNISDKEKDKIKNFLNHDEVKDIKKAKVRKEYEIKFEVEDNTFHGFIDLLLEYDDHFDIIDYKLSNIESEEYKIQLTGYKNYIEKKFNKHVNIYLYSINKDIFKKI